MDWEDGKRAAIAGTAYLMGYGMGIGGAGGGGGEESGNRWAYDALKNYVETSQRDGHFKDEPIPTYEQWLARGGAEDAKTAAEAAPPVEEDVPLEDTGFAAPERTTGFQTREIGGVTYGVRPAKYNGHDVLTLNNKVFLLINGRAVEQTPTVAAAIRATEAYRE